IYMIDEVVSIAGLKDALAADSAIGEPRERCQLYMSAFGRSAFDAAEFKNFGPDGCSQFDVNQFARF
ncbi:MAG: hypothetical protein O6766_02625, partial [Gammaproteobacteria bacterium]|nr:hypothetical protein [Gammaproteobacteria bacterium]